MVIALLNLPNIKNYDFSSPFRTMVNQYRQAGDEELCQNTVGGEIMDFPAIAGRRDHYYRMDSTGFWYLSNDRCQTETGTELPAMKAR